MTPVDPRRVEELFERLIDTSPAMRQQVLDSLGADDAGLKAEVAALLAADTSGHSILQHDAARLASRLLDTDGSAPLPSRIGRYVICALLGEGGMGVVYLAKREDLGDLVALKLLRDPWGSPARRRRFASEQLLLAGLNHRSIARLYDAGVHGETPWFAMEYVRGESIVAFCRRHELTLRERLQCFRAACEAVSHAHRNLIVHLDLKPSNVLVNNDRDVKLVDFGIARHLTDDGAADSTATVNRWLSLDYAAPEQIRGEFLDVQADVYSLGVILYELVAGSRPHESTPHGVAGMAARLHGDSSPPSLSARANPSSAVHASRAEWHELDVLCATAMHHDKSLRYRTVDALIADIDHFLRDEPLDARHARIRVYRLRKFVRRRRRVITVTAAVVLLLVTLVVAFNLRLIEARNRALSSEARMQRIHALMLNLFDGDDRAAGPAEGLRVVSLLDRGVLETDGLEDEPELQAELRHTLGGLYLKLGHPDRAEPLLVAAWTARRELFGPDHPETMQSQRVLAELRIEQSRIEEAKQLAREALTAAERRHASDSPQLAAARAIVGKVLAANGDYNEALAVLEPAVDVLSRQPPSVDLSEALGDLANTHYYLGHVDVSQALNERALPIERELFGDRHPNVAVTLFNLGNIRLDYGDYAAGERLFRRALELNESWYGPAHPKAASSALMLGRSVAYQARSGEADALYRRALEGFRAAYGEHHVRFAGVLSLMGDLARDQGRLDEAESLFNRAAQIFKTIVGEEHEFYVHQLSNLGSVYFAQGRYAEAERVLRAAVANLNAQLPQHRYTGLAEVRLGATLSRREQYAEAERHTSAGYRILQNLPGSSAVELQDARRTLEAVQKKLAER